MTRLRQAVSDRPVVCPASKWQRYVLDEVTHPDCAEAVRDECVLANAYLIQPKLDLRRFARAVDRLTQRHDSLRIQLHRIKNVWRACIDPASIKASQRIVEMDIGDVDDQHFRATISELANAPMSVGGGPLVEVLVVHCGQRGDVLITRVHHAITDGFGMIVLADDLIKLLLGIPLTGSAVSHMDYLQRFQEPLPSKARKTAEFWASLYQGNAPVIDVGRRAKGLAPLDHFVTNVEHRELACQMTGTSRRALEKMAHNAGISLPTLLFTAYLEAICSCYDIERLFVWVILGRSHPALASYAGAHVFGALLPYARANKSDIASGAKAFAATIALAMEHLPSDAARYGSAYQKNLAKRGFNLTQFGVHQLEARARQRQSAFHHEQASASRDGQPMGPFNLNPVDVSAPKPPRRASELRLELPSAQSAIDFIIAFDAHGFGEEEVRQLSQSLCRCLGIELSKSMLQ